MRGIQPGGSEPAIPAVVNEEFLEVADASVGDDVILGLSTYSIMVNIAGVASYFPTLDPGEKPFVVVDLDSFEEASNRHSRVPLVGATELWIDLSSGSSVPSGAGDQVNSGQVVESVRESGVRIRDVYDTEVMVAERVDQPLVNAGWGALLVLFVFWR